MKYHYALAFFVSAVAGALIWGSSPVLTGYTEPWDASGLFYVTGLVVGGLVSGGLVPKPLWAHYLGSVAGQLVYEVLFLNIGPLFLLGAVFLVFYSLVFLAAAAFAAHFRNTVWAANDA